MENIQNFRRLQKGCPYSVPEYIVSYRMDKFIIYSRFKNKNIYRNSHMVLLPVLQCTNGVGANSLEEITK